MESQDIEVMVADASHEVYVDTILDTALPSVLMSM